METPADKSRPTGPGARLRRGGARPVPGPAGGSCATVLGSLTIPGRPEQVGAARAFVAQTLSSNQVGADAYEATLLTSEIVTNAIQHSRSGVEGGTVTIVIIGVPRGVLVEIIDNGSAGAPIVRGDLYAVQGRGLFVVQHLAAQWGYLRDSTGTTVWFHLPAADESQEAGQRLSTNAGQSPDVPERAGEYLPRTGLRLAPRPSRRSRPEGDVPRTRPRPVVSTGWPAVCPSAALIGAC
jgi:anti-sigma regulatory factor (Ser/Thr protein kinase)